MEVGTSLDFHNTNTDTNDFNVRLETGATITDLYITPQGGTGRKIWNATRGDKLEVFDRISLEEALRD